ncbi:MAG TPA: hypothetical protein DDW20_03785 [Firmicutes bacterium]|nr:hypothetical protein [Bacillota bacterium]
MKNELRYKIITHIVRVYNSIKLNDEITEDYVNTMTWDQQLVAVEYDFLQGHGNFHVGALLERVHSLGIQGDLNQITRSYIRALKRKDSHRLEGCHNFLLKDSSIISALLEARQLLIDLTRIDKRKKVFPIFPINNVLLPLEEIIARENWVPQLQVFGNLAINYEHLERFGEDKIYDAINKIYGTPVDIDVLTDDFKPDAMLRRVAIGLTDEEKESSEYKANYFDMMCPIFPTVRLSVVGKN